MLVSVYISFQGCILHFHSIDQEYRKAVHWLETLRKHRIKTLDAGYHVCHIFSLPKIAR